MPQKTSEVFQFESAIKKVILARDMLRRDDHVIVALSGGADSVCLLLALASLSGGMGVGLSALHVHHGLRASADADEAFVRSLCKEEGIELRTVRVDAAGYAKKHGLGIEEAARLLRYEALEEERERILELARDKMREPEGGVIPGDDPGPASRVRIAAAHHMEDQAETVLFHLCRGAGITGMRGMLPVSGDLIRPLLYTDRRQIEAYLKACGRTWCHDETNDDTAYTRNYLRKEILPLLTQRVNGGTIRHICGFAEEAAQLDEALDEQAGEALLRLKSAEGVLEAAGLEEYQGVIQKRILYLFLTEFAGRRKDITQEHIRSLLALGAGGGSAELSLPYGVKARKVYGQLILAKEGPVNAGPAPDMKEGEFHYPLEKEAYEIRVFSYEKDRDLIPRGTYTKWLDYDKIGTLPDLRTRQPGDRITISGSGTVKTVARCMIDLKIPAFLRDKVVMPFAGSAALWIPGSYINAQYRITEETKTVLELQIGSRHQQTPGEGESCAE